MDLVAHVRQVLSREDVLAPGDTVVVGVSGGPDSLTLLHVLRELAPAWQVMLHVGHLNHGMRPEAQEEADYVAHLCQRWGVPCTIECVDAPQKAQAAKRSLEEMARQLRYAFLGGLALRVGARAVAVGHHADDQVETLLMHLLRGSGLAGLRGMQPVSRLGALHLPADLGWDPTRGGDILLVRPLLGVPRQAIEAYCQAHGLEPLYDRSNLDTTFLRNRIRHELLPYLETYNPNIRAVLCRTAEALAGDYEVLREVVEETWARVVREERPDRIVLDLEALRGLRPGLQRSIIREAVHRLHRSLRDLAWIHVQAAVDVLQKGTVGAEATLPGGLRLLLGYDQALIAPQGVTWPLEDRPLVWEPLELYLPGEQMLPGGRWRLIARCLPRKALPEGWQANPDPYVAYVDAERLREPLLLRPRQPGDWLIPLGVTYRQKVKDLLINAKVPRHLRDGVPLLVSAGEVVWVVGVRLDTRFAVTPETKKVLQIRFEPVETREPTDDCDLSQTRA